MKYAPITIYSDWQYSLISFGKDINKRQFVWSVRQDKTFYGEFDPGSGRTLAACLTHASRAMKHLRV